MSWLHAGGGYQLLCNRDEKRRRLPASPPRLEQIGGTRVIAPRDEAAGGTWIAVNEHRVAICLLNGANLTGPRPARCLAATTPASPSRGLVALGLAGLADTRLVASRLAQLDLSAVAPFTLVALEPDRPSLIFEWDGTDGSIAADGDRFMPLTSSSVDPAGARARRLREFHRLTATGGRHLDAAALYAFHESHAGLAGAHSPCMHRPDAATVSFSWIAVTVASIGFFYTPAAPCQLRHGETVRLAR